MEKWNINFPRKKKIKLNMKYYNHGRSEKNQFSRLNETCIYIFPWTKLHSHNFFCDLVLHFIDSSSHWIGEHRGIVCINGISCQKIEFFFFYSKKKNFYSKFFYFCFKFKNWFFFLQLMKSIPDGDQSASWYYEKHLRKMTKKFEAADWSREAKPPGKRAVN